MSKTPKVTILKISDDYNWIRIEDKTYTVYKDYDLNPLHTAKYTETHTIVVTRPKDFGGCGKDAIKLQKNVPIQVWLREINATYQPIV